MKINVIVSALLILCILISGCASNNDEPASQTAAQSDITSEEISTGSEEISAESEEVSEGPQTSDKLKKWLDSIKDDSVIMSKDEIAEHNDEIAQRCDAVVDVTQYPTELDGETLKAYLTELSPPELPKYNGAAEVTQAELDSYIANKNISAVKDSGNAVKRAIVSQRAMLKSLPTDAHFYKKVNEGNFDRIAETGLYASMPVLVLHTSADEKWYFVQSCFYRGWVSAEQIYITENDSEWNVFAEMTDFITVTEPLITVEGIKFDMGTPLPLAETEQGCEFYKVYLPVKDGDGFKTASISNEHAVSGRLPLTRENLYKQLFKYENTPYGWGDDIDGVDCSSYAANVYRTFGFTFPRNSSQQQNTVGCPSIAVGNMTDEAKSEFLESFDGPYPCYMNGHVIIYLGKLDGEHYIIHSNATTMSVAETLLDLTYLGGKDYLPLLTWIAPIE